MSVVPFIRGRRQVPPPPTLALRFRRIIDRYQVLALSQPVVALWLVEWLELFIGKHLD